MNVRVSGADLGIAVEPHQPLRAIIDSGLKVPPSSHIFQLTGDLAAQTVVFTHKNLSAARLQAAGFNNIQLVNPGGIEKIDLAGVMQWLGEQQANEVHVEAGSILCGALLDQGLVDELVIYMAAHIMGDSARGLFHLPNLNSMYERISLEIKEIRPIGKDWRITAVPV